MWRSEEAYGSRVSHNCALWVPGIQLWFGGGPVVSSLTHWTITRKSRVGRQGRPDPDCGASYVRLAKLIHLYILKRKLYCA